MDRAATPASCGFCRRGFKSQRGVKQHQRFCSRNPDARMFQSGEYDMLVKTVPGGFRIVGFIWNGTDDFHRQRIRSEYDEITDALGVPASERWSYDRIVALGWVDKREAG